MKLIKIAALILGITLLASAPVLADETGDAIGQSLKYYQAGKLTKAIGELEFALAQMKQQKAEAMQKLFPEAPAGWKSLPGKNAAAAGGFLGGGISASQEYRQASGRGNVKMEAISDSPMVAGMAAMLSNPAYMQSNQGSKLIRFQGQKAMVTSRTDDQAELQTLINNKLLFKVTVRQTAGAADVARQFADSVDMDKLSQFAQ